MSSQPRSPRDKEDGRREGAATRDPSAASEGAANARPRQAGNAPRTAASSPRSRPVTPKPPSARARTSKVPEAPPATTPIPTRSRPPGRKLAAKEAASVKEPAVPAKSPAKTPARVKAAKRAERAARTREEETAPLHPSAHQRLLDAQRLSELSERADLQTIPREFRDAPSEVAAPDLGAPSRRYLAIAVGLVVVACVGAIGWFAAGPASPAGPSVTSHPERSPLPSTPAPAVAAPPHASAAAEAPATPSPPPEVAPEAETAVTSAARTSPVLSPASGTVPPSRASAPAPASSTPAPSAAPNATAEGAGFLNINSLPASDVVLDGDPIGSTPLMHVRVAAGPHTVVFKNADLGVMKGISVTVGEGETKVASARLRE
jgi:hypothetical protein